MKNTYNTFLISFSAILVALGFYIYFNGFAVQAAVSSTSHISSQNGDSPLTSISDSNDKISADTAFLLSLTSLTKIKIDISLFNNELFEKLNDNTVHLEQPDPGRPNPFAPIDSSIGNPTSIASPIITDQPVKITNKTAVLSGTISNLTGVTNTYFEYGPTPTLGKITPQAPPSLIGTFIINIIGLSPQTTYFYRAVAKVNGVPLYGEVVSFDTQ